MFYDLDLTLANILEKEVAVKDLSITFAAPFGDSFISTNSPTLNLFLYDVRENWELRSNEWLEERRDGRGYRQKPPARVDCSYMITAWAGEGGEKGVASEHELLGEVMRVLLRHRHIPEEYLKGDLKGQEPPVRAKALHPGNLQSMGEYWQAMGGKPKAALNYTLTISVPLAEPEDLGPLVSETIIRLEHGVKPKPA
jgi:hypothetical protein